MDKNMNLYLDYIREHDGKNYIDDEYKSCMDELVNEFRSKLPKPDRTLEYSFVNYLNQIIEANGGHINDSVRGTANYLINTNYEVKKHILGDDAIERLFSMSDKVFPLARRALLIEDFPIDPRTMDFHGIAEEAKKLSGESKPHNRLLACFLQGENISDLNLISNPLGSRVSHRMAEVYYEYKDESYRAFRKKFHTRIRKMRSSLAWKRYSMEEACQREFEVYAEMKEQELGIKTDRSKSIGLNIVKLCKGEER